MMCQSSCGRNNMAGTVVVVSIVLLASTACGGGLPEGEKYTTRWDNINVDEVLSSERLIKNYVKCLLDKGPCTADGAELRRTLPEALASDCSRCSAKQKAGSTKVIHFLIDNRKDDWEKLEAKFDPTGAYRIKYEAQEKEGDVKVAPVTE